MKLKLFTFLLILSVGVQAQSFLRVNDKDGSNIGIPVARIDSITHFRQDSTFIYLKDSTIFKRGLNRIENIATATPVANNLYNVISKDDTLTFLKQWIDSGRLNPYPLALSGDYTVFAPVDTSLKIFGTPDRILSAIVVAYHTIQGKFDSTSFPIGENTKYFTMNRPIDSVFVTKYRDTTDKKIKLFVNGIRIDSFNSIQASNGVIHKLGTGLVGNTNFPEYIFPPTRTVYAFLKSDTTKTYDSIVKLIDRAGAIDSSILRLLNTEVVTLIAPINSAVRSFLTNVWANRPISQLTDSVVLNLVKRHIIMGRKFIVNFQQPLLGSIRNLNNNECTFRGISPLFLPNFIIPTLGIDKADAILVTRPNLIRTNGVIHGALSVLLDR